MGPTVAVALLVLTGGATALALAGCARRGVRQWACHGAGALAMAAMVLPGLSPLPAGAWVAVLAGTALWTTGAVVRARLRGDDVAGGAAGAREITEAWLMCLLLLLVPEHGTAAGAAAGAGAHHGAAAGPGAPWVALAGLVLVWGAAVVAAHRRGSGGAGHHPGAGRSRLAAAGSVLGVASMLAMAGAMAVG